MVLPKVKNSAVLALAMLLSVEEPFFSLTFACCRVGSKSSYLFSAAEQYSKVFKLTLTQVVELVLLNKQLSASDRQLCGNAQCIFSCLRPTQKQSDALFFRTFDCQLNKFARKLSTSIANAQKKISHLQYALTSASCPSDDGQVCCCNCSFFCCSYG